MSQLIQILQGTQLFGTLHNDELLALAQKTQQVHYTAGAQIIQEGIEGRELFIIVKGSVQVYTKAPDGTEIVLAKLDAGAYFGEQALLSRGNKRRNASIRAFSDVQLLKITKEVFQWALSKNSPLKENLLREGQEQLRHKMLTQSKLFRSLKIADGATWQEEVDFAPGEVVFHEGDDGEHFYLILSGTAGVYKSEGGQQKLVARLEEGRGFGELALLEKRVRSATVKAESNLTLMRIGREAFVTLYEGSPELRSYLQTLQKVYSLTGYGFVTQHVGNFLGDECITSLFHLKDGRTAISSQVIGRTLFNMQFAQETKDDVQKVRFVDTDAALDRELLIANTKIVGLTIQGPWNELGRAHRMLLEGTPISEERLQIFRDTGSLQFEALRPTFGDEDILCDCLQVTRGALREAVRSGNRTLPELANATGATTVCGACSSRLKALLGRPDWVTVQIDEERQVAEEIRSFRFVPRDGQLKASKPGQHILVQARINGQWVQRPYTISSSCGRTDHREITVKRVPNGFFSGWLFDEPHRSVLVQMSDPQGNYHIEIEHTDPIVFFAGGIGITPALAMARSFNEEGSVCPLLIHYSARRQKQFAFLEELQGLENHNHNISLTLRETSKEGRLSPKDVREIVAQQPESTSYYLCGPPAYTDAVISMLKRAGVKPDNIHAETFQATGGKPPDKPAPTKVAGGRAYFAIGIALLLAFFLQDLLSLKWPWLESLQQNKSYKQWSGVPLLLFFATLWLMPLLRAIQRHRQAARTYPLHKVLGALSPLLYYIHSTSFGYAYLGFLSIVFFSNTALGLLNKEILPLPSAFSQRFSSSWLVLHVVLSVLLMALLSHHIFLVYYYR